MIREEVRRFAEDPGAWGEVDRASGLTRILTERWLDGVPVATARALVRARWDDAGGRPLCTHAGRMSRPILERLGFEAVAEQEIMLDPATC